MRPFRKILFPTDFSDTSLAALSAAVEFAGESGGELLLVHVVPVETATPWDVPPYADFGLAAMPVAEYEEKVRSEVRRRLDRLAADRVPPAVRSRVIVGRGEPAKEIVHLAEEEHADLIVIATHGWTGWRHFVFGSVAEKVIREAACPVLSIRGAAVAAGVTSAPKA